MLWVKAFHIVFVSAWFAGVFYLPRILVNLAQVDAASHAERERLLLMGRKLHRFALILMGVALVLGTVLWLGYGIGRGPGNGWLHAKLALVALVVAYQFHTAHLLDGFARGRKARGERWLRVYNEISVLAFTAIVLLVVLKPF